MGESQSTQPQRQPWYRHKLAREIIAVLVFKVFALAFLYFAFFRAEDRTRIDPREGPPFLSSASMASEETSGDV